MLVVANTSFLNQVLLTDYSGIPVICNYYPQFIKNRDRLQKHFKMKRIKNLTLGILGATVLSLGLFACSNYDETIVRDNNNEEMFSQYVQRKQIDDDYFNFMIEFTNDFNQMKTYFNEIMYVGYELMEKDGVLVSNPNEVINYYENCNDCNDGIKPFMLDFFREIIKEKEVDGVLKKISEYQNKISVYSLSEIDKESVTMIMKNIRIIIENSDSINTNFSNKDQYYTTFGWGSCMAANGGRTMGEGIATGFIAGCIGGAYKGAIGGTIALPGIGTTAGVVGGCIFGGAAGAAVGVIGNMGLQGLKCLFR